MSAVDFDLNLKIGQKEILLKKEELIKLDDENYLICLKEKDTEITNKSIPAEITLYIPDEDFDDGINIKKSKTIIDLIILK